MLNLLDKLSLWVILLPAILLGIAPPGSKPHLVEKLEMLLKGALVKPIDIFDLVLHSIFILLLFAKLWRMARLKHLEG